MKNTEFISIEDTKHSTMEYTWTLQRKNRPLNSASDVELKGKILRSLQGKILSKLDDTE